MAHFLGKIEGSRKPITRLGTKASGLSTTAASWDGAIHVHVWYDSETDKNYFSVSQIPWHGKGISSEVYSGIIGA